MPWPINAISDPVPWVASAAAVVLVVGGAMAIGYAVNMMIDGLLPGSEDD